MTTLKVNEIFYSIQGEGYWSGSPATFIRLCGCNLKCSWCDTKHDTVYLEAPANQVVQEAISITNLHCKEIDKIIAVITGGEPTIWAHRMWDLARQLKNHFSLVAIETNGTLPHGLVKLKQEMGNNLWITWSPKPSFFFYLDYHLQIMAKIADEVKIVYEPEIDFNSWKNLLANSSLFDNKRAFIQPCSQDFEPAICFVKNHPEWRLSVQTQKIMNIK